MRKWSQQDLNQIQNILIALKKARFDVQGEEILAFGQAVRWVSILHEEVAKDLKPMPSQTELVAQTTSKLSQEKSKSKKKK